MSEFQLDQTEVSAANNAYAIIHRNIEKVYINGTCFMCHNRGLKTMRLLNYKRQ